MTPTLVHRYAFPIREAIEALLGDAVGDCESWRIRIEGDEVVIDVVAPVLPESVQNMRAVMSAPSAQPSVDDLTSLKEARFAHAEKRAETGEEAAEAKAFGADSQTPDSAPELKGGPLARRAAIACGERGFWTFLGVDNADEAKADVCRRCGITTRKMLDHDERAASVWHDIDGKYRLWLEGHDVELD